MIYVNKKDYNKICAINGHKAEQLFQQLAEGRGYQVSPASKNENIYQHIDLKLEIYNSLSQKKELITVDVKSQKKTNRSDQKPDNEWTILEYKNVKGNAGWLHGKATHIAFEREDDFVTIPRHEILKWAKTKLEKDSNGNYLYAKNTSDYKYKLRNRTGTQDLITQVRFTDMLSEIKESKIWLKKL